MESGICGKNYSYKGFRLDPRTKIYILLILNIVIISGTSKNIGFVLKPILSTIPFILLFASGKRKVSFVYIGVYISSFLIDMFLLSYIKGIGGMIIALVSAFGVRWFPCAIMGYFLLSTTKVSEFVGAMESMHVSRKIIIPLSVIFRFFPTVFEEYRAINSAMSMRSIRLRSFFKNPIAMIEYRLVPLLMSVVKIGDELSAAALTRGLGGTAKRTNICEIGFHLLDMIFALIVTIIFLIYIIY